MNVLKKVYYDNIEKIVSDDVYRLRIQNLIVCLLIVIIGFTMSIINFVTQTINLLVITGLLFVTGISTALIIIKTKKSGLSGLIIGLFSLVLIISFLFDGGVDGFSPFWMCLVPFVSFFIYGLKKGMYIGVTVVLMVVAILWTPVSNYLIYPYSDSFIIRFPILYAACLLIAWAFEFVRHYTYLKLKTTINQLENLTRIDELTKIENRRAFNIRLNELWLLFSNKDSYISILMLDVDYFKKYNDTYGHLEGDKVLKNIAETICSVVNKKDGFVARWGGEEFVILLPFYDLDGARTIGEEILSAIRLSAIPHRATELESGIITVSAGLATAFHNNIEDSNKLIELADQSLYEAKNSGRNRIGCVFINKKNHTID